MLRIVLVDAGQCKINPDLISSVVKDDLGDLYQSSKLNHL